MIERIWLHVTSGRGPVECQMAVAKLASVIVEDAIAQGLACSVLETVAGEQRGAALSALLSLEGEADRVIAFASRSAGSVLWICVSPVRPTHKRKNWFVGVEVLSPPDASHTGTLKISDVTFEAMRASGPGGQHVNKTESAIRATHRPTGLVAVAREERSQVMNKKLALARLAAQLKNGKETAVADANHDRWATHNALERGAPKRTFKGEAFLEVV